MPGGQGALTQFGHPRRGGPPFPMPAALVTIVDPVCGGQRLAQMAPK